MGLARPAKRRLLEMSCRILIADDHTVVRQGLRQILCQALGKESVIEEAESARKAAELVQGHDWDLLILDITMPDGDGLELLKEIRKWKPTLPVLVLSIYPEDQYALRVLKAGGKGYLSKGSSGEEIIDAVRKLLAGGRYLSRRVAEQMAFELGGEKWKNLPCENLSDREYEVLRLITEGKSVSEVAKWMHLSVKTVSTYRRRILEKTHLKTTADLIRFGLDNRLTG